VAGFCATGKVDPGGWVGVAAGAGVWPGWADPTGMEGDVCMLINALFLCFYMRPVHRTATATLRHGLCQYRLTGSQNSVLLKLSLESSQAAQSWRAAKLRV